MKSKRQAALVWGWACFLSATGGVSLAQEAAAPIRQAEAGYSVTYSPHAAGNDCNVNLGATGATAWLRGYDLVVVSIQQRSPGYGQLKLGDVIVGAAGKTFGPDVDPRITLGNAIGTAEATGEPLVLNVLRDGATAEVKVSLAKLGAYPAVGMGESEKSKRIVDRACRSLIDSQMPDGAQVSDGSMGTFLTGLLLLGSAQPEYLDGARRAAYKASEYDYESFDYNNWSLGYGGVTLAEYYLATGDDSVLPKLEEIAGKLARGQMKCGSWGHKSPAGGYGAVSQTGLVDAIALVMARECGVKVDEAAIDRTLTFFSQFAGLGSIPYGDHQPFNSLDNNGANSSAAVLFHLAGRDKEAKLFADSVAESYWLREEGHTGAFFSILWGPMGASVAGDEKLQKFLDYQKWYYDLAREWTGGITFLPYKEALTRFDDSGYIYFGPDFTTGGMAMAYITPRKHLQICGAPKSVFAASAKLSGDLKTARDQYLARNWAACDASINGIDSASLGDDDKRLYAQLVAARDLSKAATDQVLTEIDSNLEDGGQYRASQQFEALKRCLGTTGDPRFTELDKRFAESQVQWYVREGKDFYTRWEAINAFTVKSWVPQGPQAKALLEGVPTARLPIWEPLSATSQLKPQAWRIRSVDGADQLEGWEQPGFDDSNFTPSEGITTVAPPKKGARDVSSSQGIVARHTFTVDDLEGEALRVRLRTVRNASTQVYLNGTLIVNVERGQRGGYASIRLQDRVFDLLKKGENVLAARSSAQGSGANQLDVGLERCRGGSDRRHLPIERYDYIETADLPEAETSLQVSRTMDAYREGLSSAYLKMPLETLIKELDEPIGYYRGLAEDALVERGADGIRSAVARMEDANWMVREAALSVLDKTLTKAAKAKDEQAIASLAEYMPSVQKCLTDENTWVRTLACKVIGQLGTSVKDVIPALVDATNDSHPWVRDAALAALMSVDADVPTLHSAALQAMSQPFSSYGIPKKAYTIAAMPEGDAATKLKMILTMIATPAEGDGGTTLADAMKLGCKLDPDGKQMVPVLSDAASDKTGLGRQRGNPRGAAIEALGSYGSKAASATDALNAILADENAKAYHAAANAALKQIAG